MMKKSIKILISLSVIFVAVVLTAIITISIITADANLNPEKLVNYDKTIAVFDDCGNKVENACYLTKNNSVNIEELNEHTINAFIASEDRDFFKHNGINPKRMLKAFYKNVTSRSFKEGASTISQQLIKNTHLNNDKTIARKLKEIKLSRQLEKKYTKQQILETYLNTIYFGHSCYGLENASQFYFGIPASDLSLEQSATIVGLLTSPNNYSPFKNPEKCLSRRNTVLKSMLICNYIDEQTYANNIKLPLSTIDNPKKQKYSNYFKAVIAELEDCGINPYDDFKELRIETYLNQDVQSAVENLDFEYDGAVIVRTVEGGVCAYRTDAENLKRQIGSTAKPLFVYAPSLEEKKLNIFTKIKDEPINFNGYSPENYDKKYHGNVTVLDSIAYSYNIPAVKSLNALTINTADKYAKKMGITLTNEDKNLSLALGGTKSGLTIKEVCDCYSIFPSCGYFKKSSFIKRICDQDGKILYEQPKSKEKVFSQSTCSLMNTALIETVKKGTAKKLKDLEYEVACKTGTCGDKNGNTDAYAIAYTSKHCIGIWAGDKDNKKIDITGGGYCCNLAKQLLSKIYTNNTYAPLDTKSGTKEIEIDREEYENKDKVILCDDCCPKLNRLTVRCANNNLPIEKSNRFSSPKIKKPTIIVDNNKICIILCQTKYYSYIIRRQNKHGNTVVYDGEWKNEVIDEPINGEYIYSVTPYFKYGNKKFFGEEIFLKKVIINNTDNDNASDNDKIPGIAKKDWYNQ
ncbi:MAG: transglycosylase domain-containing protein [Candidatus Coproplasma sp.]